MMLKKIDSSLFLGLILSSLIFGYFISNLFFIFTLITGIFFIIKNKKYCFYPSILPIIIYYIYELLSLLNYVDQSGTYRLLTKHLPMLIIPLLYSQIPKLKKVDFIKSIRIFSVFLIAYLFCCFIYAFWQYHQKPNIYLFFYHQLVSIFDNHAIYISIFCAFCLLSLLNNNEKKRRDYFYIILLIIFLIFLSSKNVFITTIIIQLIIFLYESFKNKKIKKSLFSIFILTSAILFILFTDNLFKRRFQEETRYNNFKEIFEKKKLADYPWSGISIRIFQLKLGVDMLNDHNAWVFGIGNFQSVLDQYYKKYETPYFYSFNLHNQYMQTLVQHGVIGLIILLIMIVLCIYQSIKYRNIYLFIFILQLLFLFITESFFERQKGILFFSFLYTILMIMDVNPKNKLSKKLKDNSNLLNSENIEN